MSEIVTRLLLNTKDFDVNLSKSKRGVKDYEGGISSFAKTAGAGIAKFAAGLGVAMGAGEAFNRTLQSSQTLGDMTAANMSAAKRSIDEFFYSIGSGDFTGFLSGLENIISKAKDAYAAIDQLGNTRISHGYFNSKYNAEIAESRTLAQNKQAPTNERVAAFDEWKKGINKQVGINSTLQSDLTTAITKAIESEIGLKNFSVNFNDFERALEIDVTNPLKRSDLKQQYSDSYKEYVKGIDWIESKRKTSISQAPARSFEINKKYDNEIESLTQQHREAIIVNAMLNKYKDEELQELANQATQYQNLNTSISSLIKEFNVAAVKFNKTNKADKDFKNVESFEGYKVYVDNETKGGNSNPKVDETKLIAADADYWIQQLNTSRGKFEQKIATLTPIQIPAELEVEPIEELPKSELEVTLKARLVSADFAKKKIAELQQLMTVANTDTERKEIASMISMWRENGNIFDNKDIKLNNDYADSLYSIGDAMNNISGLVDDDTASVLRWGAAIFNTIGQSIPALMSMFAVKETDTQLTNENTNANIANASSKAMAAYSGIPFVGVALGVAAIATIAAAMMSIPKFETGGIVGGNYKSGDKILARLNSGEMVLNQGQQANLFRLLNGGDRIGNSVIVSGKVIIRGGDTFLSLSNYMRQTGKRLPR